MKNWTKKFTDDNLFNTSILESKNFRIIPSIGAMVEGWLLLIPKSHIISFCYLSQELVEEFEELKTKTINLLESVYEKPVVVFENGAIEDKTNIGCGVDYAHLHLVPFKIDVRNIVDSHYDCLLDWKNVSSFTEILDIRKNTAYYYLEFDNRKIYTEVPNSSSQLIRKGIAKKLNIPLSYDWKEFSFVNNVIKTIEKLEVVETLNHSYVRQ